MYLLNALFNKYIISDDNHFARVKNGLRKSRTRRRYLLRIKTRLRSNGHSASEFLAGSVIRFYSVLARTSLLVST